MYFKTRRLKILEFQDGREKGAKWSGGLYLKLNKKRALQLQTDKINAPKTVVE